MSSNTQSFGLAGANRTERGSRPDSRTTISPGSTSRTYSAPTMSSAVVSLESTHASPAPAGAHGPADEVRDPPEDEGPEPVGIPDPDDPVAIEHEKRVRAADPRQQLHQG